MSLISIVIPVYNEQECLQALMVRLQAVQKQVGEPFEYIFVNDGSRDNSRAILESLAAQFPDVRPIHFSRNFGHEAATTAGIDHAAGDAVVIIDADLQDPPEVIPELIAKWREGNEVVYAQRAVRKGEGAMKRFSSWMFYRTIRALSEVEIPCDTGDFRLMDRRAVRQFRRCREESRFVRGLVAWTGFRQAAVRYERDERYAGVTKYNPIKLIMLALDAVLGFSVKPLRYAMTLGLLVTLVSLLVTAMVIIERAIAPAGFLPWHGYALLACGVFFLGGVQIFLIGLVGEYVSRTYRQSQQRPLYIIADKSPALPPGDEGLHSDAGGKHLAKSAEGPGGIDE